MWFAQQWAPLSLQEKSQTSSSPAPVLFCRDYQQEQCINVKDHFDFIRGESKRLRHICATCWTRLQKQKPQRENPSDCSGCQRFVSTVKTHRLHNTKAGSVPDFDLGRGFSVLVRLESRLLFSCPSSSFSIQDNEFLEILQSWQSVFDNATPPATSCFVDAYPAVFSSGKFNYTGIRIVVPSRLNITAWHALLQ